MTPEIQEKIEAEAKHRFPMPNGICVGLSSLDVYNQGVKAGVFESGAEYGYSLAQPEIEALNREVERLRNGGWISVKDRLPELVDPFIMIDDDGNKEIVIEKHSATVLAWNEYIGFFKAQLTKRGWSEISSISNRSVKETEPAYWQPLPTPPNNKEK